MSQSKEATEVNEKGWKVTKIRNDKGELIKTFSEKACGCKKTTGYAFNDYSGYDDVELCDLHQYMFDKEVKEWEQNTEGDVFPDDVEFFFREESSPSFITKQDKATQTD